MTTRCLVIITAVLALGAGRMRAQGSTPESAGPAPAPPAPTRVTPSINNEEPVALAEPFRIEALLPADFTGKSHYYTVKCQAAGVHEMVVRYTPADPASGSRVIVWVPDACVGGGQARYNAGAGESRFYPVLPAGESQVAVSTVDSAPDEHYELSLAPDPCDVTDALKARARQAVARGTARLLAKKPAELDYTYQHAIESLVLMALLGPKDLLPKLEQDYLAWLAEAEHKDEHGTWDGEPVSYFGGRDNLYDQAIVAMAAAEAVSAGSATARPIALAAQRFVLAAQLTSRRCAAWGPIGTDNKHYGGWRYEGSAVTGDISVSGWCMVALLAGDAAGVRESGLRDALDNGSNFVRHCFRPEGFTYMIDDNTGDVRNAIGAMTMLLMGEEGAEVTRGLAVLDQHLPAGTTVLEGEEYPTYYTYYGTRANYLRPGKRWETWRSVTMRQFIRLQNPDGSWPGFGQEEGLGDRYSTAMAVMILRICLNDVPAYLQHEARGF